MNCFQINIVFLSILLLSFPAQTQFSDWHCGSPEDPTIFAEGYEEGVIVLAYSGTTDEAAQTLRDRFSELESYRRKMDQSYGYGTDDSAEDNYELLNSLLSDLIDWDPNNFQYALRQTQIDIAKYASDLNQVIIFVKDNNAFEDLNSEYDFEFQEKIREGKIKLIISDFDGPWIRDYGPFIKKYSSNYEILDAHYQDSRNNDRKERGIYYANETKGSLIEKIIDQYEDLDRRQSQGYDVDELRESVRDNEERLKVYDSYLDYLSLTPAYRNYDDVFPELMANELMDVRKFTVSPVDLNMDGGNFIRTPDCDCIFTYDIIAKNENNSEKVKETLENNYLCERLIFLDPLPKAIKHVDMFLTPLGNRKVILPSFNPEESFLSEHFKQLSNPVKEQALKAEMSMRRNGKILNDFGYEVEFVPGLLPQEGFGDMLFYPTIMNSLIQVGKIDDENIIQILFPYYQDIQEDVQEYSLQKIEEAFAETYGGRAKIISKRIVCNEVAKLQGAVHCLTLTIPWGATTFADKWYTEEYKNLLTIANALPTPELHSHFDGTWTLTGVESLMSDEKVSDVELGIVFKFTSTALEDEESISENTFTIINVEDLKDGDYLVTVRPYDAAGDYLEYDWFVSVIDKNSIKYIDDELNAYSFERLD